MVISARAIHVVMNGLSDLRSVGSQHMTSRVWDSPQCHVMAIMFRKFVKSCILSFDSAGNSRRVQHIDRIMS
jgi:hypothetical protein